MRKILFLTLVLLILSACVPQEIRELSKVEVKEYEGKRLDSISNFRENSIKGIQSINISEYTLKITGLVETEKEYTYDEVLENQKYSKVVQLFCVEGWSAEVLWEGVLFRDVISKAVPKDEANTVIFHAYDGYSTSLPLNYLTENDILLAYKINNITLPPDNGYPFQLVAEDKLGYKWARWITSIELSDNPDYRGTWEIRGYSNTADVGDSYYE